jgi:hypothetical protein
MLDVTFRISGPADDHALARLAALDSAKPPDGPVVLAEADSRVVAALPLRSGRAIADPFEPTADLVALLELERKRLLGSQRERRWSLLRRRASHAAT